jgi:pyrophosphatase PpaX
MDDRGYKAVLFDLDGTLIDTYELILSSMRYSTRTTLGREFSDEELMSLVGTPLDDQMVYFAGGDKRLGVELAAVYREHNERVHDEMIRGFSGVPEMLSALKEKHIRLAVVTSKRHALALRGIRCCGLEEYLDFVIGPDDFPAHKPDPGPVMEGYRRLGLDADACLYVGDSPYDIQAGNAAGCDTVAVSWGVFSREVLKKEHPTYVVDTPSELVALTLGFGN